MIAFLFNMAACIFNVFVGAWLLSMNDYFGYVNCVCAGINLTFAMFALADA